MKEPNPFTLPPDARRKELLRVDSTCLRFSLQGFAITLVSSYLCAAAYVLATLTSLPPSDKAYRSPLVLLDPFVWAVAIPVATAIAVIVFPFALFSLWHRNVLRCGAFVLSITLLTIFSVTPFSSLLAIPASVLVTVFGLLFCRVTDLPLFRQPADPTSTM